MAISTPPQITIDRIQASKLLGVSVRTVDRYIKNGKLSAYQKNGRILLKRNDVIDINKNSLMIKHRPIVNENQKNVIRPRPRYTPPSVREINAVVGNNPYIENSDSPFYKDLYEEAQKRLSEYQRKHEQLIERIGQLESEIHFSAQKNILGNVAHVLPVPQQIERIENNREERYKTEKMTKEIEDREKEVISLKEGLMKARTNKIAFAVITYVLLILQPIFWWLLR